MKYPNILSVHTVQTISATTHIEVFPGKWVPVRPEGYPSLRHRFKAAWMVFTGKADALVWIKQ